ncbi:hsp90 co-chaperone Cdc37 [Neocloeon triangulifer]|uniref:hsp90 co-chaperone Cdc37 n=1 Tax=Neocloeon triangulifer TaxID=2078957 RepID=UPI00286F84A9|nr:hsp90 co-chaperone Cdc37 [Neocloeon triangulifer]
MVDYSKWKDIEISDDEDDTHPNIDTPSLFKWRHEARVQRMEEERREQERLAKEKAEFEKKLKVAKENSSAFSLQQLEAERKKIEEMESELKKQEKLQPWNVDTISAAGFSKTVINNPPPPKEEEPLTEEEQAKKLKEFTVKNESLLKKYGMLRRFEDSKKLLTDNPQLVCDETSHYLLIWCINLEMEEKSSLMEHVAHQCICMQFILELAKHMKVDPRACVPAFYRRMESCEAEYLASFNDELNSLKERIRVRAKQKLQLAIEEIEKEEREKRLGPGGLDPVEVFESLPKELQDCFENKDIPKLQQILSTMPEEDARYHLKRCIDSGMWIPDGRKREEEAGAVGGEEAAASGDGPDVD